MKTKIVYLTVGLPRSGKSTWAKEQGVPIVNRDSIRLALHGQAYLSNAESMVTAIEDYMFKSLLLAGHDIIIIDATHLKEKYKKRWEYLLKDMYADPEQWVIREVHFHTSKEECIQRAKADGREDLIPIIERMDEEKD